MNGPNGIFAAVCFLREAKFLPDSILNFIDKNMIRKMPFCDFFREKLLNEISFELRFCTFSSSFPLLISQNSGWQGIDHRHGWA